MPHDVRPLQSRETVLANARLVLETETVAGSLVVRDGRIAAVDTGRAVPRGAEDMRGDLLAPGLIELHTDNLERHLEPRPGVVWPEAPAILAHDAELAGCGITTVFDALRVGSLLDAGRSATASTPARSPPRSPRCATPASSASATASTSAPRSAPRPSSRSSPSSTTATASASSA